MTAPGIMVSLSELAAHHLSRNKDLGCSKPVSPGRVDILFSRLRQSSRALPLLLHTTPTAPGFSLSCEANVIQQTPGIDADVQPKVTSLKRLPSLAELIQDRSKMNNAATFNPLTSVKTETGRRLSLSEYAAHHISKDSSSRPEIITSENSGGTYDSFLELQDLRRALPPFLSPTSTPPGFSLHCPQATISQRSSGLNADVHPKVSSLKGFLSLGELLQDNSGHSSTGFNPLTFAKTDTITESMLSLCLTHPHCSTEPVEQHRSMDIDLQSESNESPANTQTVSATTSASPSSLGAALCLPSLPRRSRKHQSKPGIRAEPPPRCPTLTPAMFYLPPIRGDSSDTSNGAPAAKQQEQQERALKNEDVLVLWPGQIEVVKTNTFYQVLYHPLPKFKKADPQRPPIVPFKFDTPSPDDIALARRMTPYTREEKPHRANRRLKVFRKNKNT